MSKEETRNTYVIRFTLEVPIETVVKAKDDEELATQIEQHISGAKRSVHEALGFRIPVLAILNSVKRVYAGSYNDTVLRSFLALEEREKKP